MLNASTIEQLRAMKFSAMAAAFEQQLKEPKSYSQLSFEERFGLMVDAEWNRRQDNKLRRRVRDARLDIPSASMEGIEYIPDRGLDKQQLLRLSTCAYIEERHHVILKGASGSGKTYLACALGYAACTKFKKVRYVRMPEFWTNGCCARLRFNRPLTCWRSLKPGPSTARRSSAPSTIRTVGMSTLTPTPTRTVPLPMPSWTGSSTTPISSPLAAASPCASAMACTQWRTAVMASEQSLQACTQGNAEVPEAIP